MTTLETAPNHVSFFLAEQSLHGQVEALAGIVGA